MNLSKKDKLELLDELDKRKSVKSLFYFGKHVLGYDLDDIPHRELCDFIQDESIRFKLILLPRGSYKTSVISQVYPLWQIIRNPNVRILLDSELLQNSQNNLKVLAGHLERNERFRHLFGDYVSKKWTQEYLQVSKRTNLALRDPTVATGSVETISVGTHWDVCIADDIQSEKNSKTKAQIEQVYEHFRLVFGLLEPSASYIVVGTRWADLDVYGRIMEDHKDFKVLLRSAFHDSGALYFPGRLTTEFLAQQKAQLGSVLFNSQYLNNPLPDKEISSFKKSWFRYDNAKAAEVKRVFVAYDPALPGDSVRADNSAVVAGGLDAGNNLVVMDYEFGIWEPYQAIQKIFAMAQKYEDGVIHGGGIGIETNLFQQMLKFEFDRENKKRGKFYKTISLKHRRGKEERILALQPLYESGSCYHMNWMKDGMLEEELLWFPKGRHDDLIDAAASLVEMCRPVGLNIKAAEVSYEERVRLIAEDYAKLQRIPLVNKSSGWTYEDAKDGFSLDI